MIITQVDPITALKEKRKLRDITKKKYYKILLLFILSRIFINLTYPLLQSTNKLTIIISREQGISFNEFKYKPLIGILDTIVELESVVNQFFASIYIYNKLIFEHNIKYNFDKVINNNQEKDQFVVSEGAKNYRLFTKVKFYKDIKNKDKINKLNTLLKDKDLIKNFYKAVVISYPQLRTRKTVKTILQMIKKNKMKVLLSFIVRKLVRRRRYLWKHINIIMSRVNFFLIGKDYKIYVPEVARTYISQTNKYFINFSQIKRLNAKHVKCIELIFDRGFRIEFKRFFRYIFHINKILYYFYNRFPHILLKYSPKLFDKRFAVPYKGKNYSFNEIMRRFLTVNKKGKYKLMLRILLVRKHKVEKRLLKSLQKRRQLPLDKFINIMEREKYYPKHRRTKIPLKIYKWLMKHVYDDIALEHRETSSRPRVIIEKREELVEATYPYLPRDPLKFQRDVSNEQFKRTKELKYHIIKLTKPKVVLQPKFFSYYKSGGLLSRNLLKTKLNSKVNIPIRIQRIIVACESFYKNLFKANFYKNFINLIKRFKILYLYKPELKTKISSFIGFFLCLIVSPIFRGISEEREYAHQLKVFLNNYLIRLRLFKRYDLAEAFNVVTEGYIFPQELSLAFFKRLVANARKIMQKKPNYNFMKYMFRKSFKRLTIRIRSKAATIFGLMPLFRHNLMSETDFSPMYLKKNFMNRGYYYLAQPNVDFKAKSKYKLFFSALKRTFGYSAAYQINSKFYYFSPYNLFLKKFDKELFPEEDIITKYQND